MSPSSPSWLSSSEASWPPASTRAEWLSRPALPCWACALGLLGRFSGFGLREFDPEHAGHIGRRDRLLPGVRLLFAGLRQGFLDQFQMIDFSQDEQQIGLVIEPRSDTVHDGGDVLAHAGPIRTGTGHLDLARLGEQAALVSRHDIHHALRQLPLEQFHERTDLSRAARLDTTPLLLRQGRDIDGDLIKFGSADRRRDLARVDLQIHHRAVADIRATARQTVFIVAVGFHVVAPRLAPERPRDGPAFDDDRRNRLTFLSAFLDLTGSLGSSLGYGNVRSELEEHR